MQLFTTIVCTVSLLASSIKATPIESRQDAPSKFNLKTKPITNTGIGSNKTDLYIQSYHTGAGLGIAAGFNGSAPNSSFFYLNETKLLWDYMSEESLSVGGGWNTILEYLAYASFASIDISIADGPATPGFFINATGLQSNATDGWLVCDWAYSAPQLFYLVPGYDASYPLTCSEVDLVVEAFSD